MSENKNSTSSDQRWSKTLGQLQQDIVLWILLVGIMMAQRLSLVLIFRSQWSPDTEFESYLRMLFVGLRYDISIASYLAIPCFLASVTTMFGMPLGIPSFIRAVWAPIVVIGVLVLGVVDGVFFAEFHQQFNSFAFGVFQGYLGPVIQSAWAEYPLGWLGLGILVGGTILLWGLRWLLSRNWLCTSSVLRRTQSPWLRITLVTLCILGIAIGARGGLGNRPVQFKDSSATADQELNKLVPNAVCALRYAVQQHLRLNSVQGLGVYLKGESITEAAAGLSGEDQPKSVTSVVQRVSGGPSISRPEHIFFIVMESADSWAMKPEFESLHLADEMKELAERGIAADFFVTSSAGSVESVASILTGLPEVGVTTNYQPNSRQAYSTSIAPQMKELGYTPQYFKGSFLAFQRYGDFAREQGFESVEGAAVIRHEQEVQTNEWGVQDCLLFDHVLGQFDKGTPTFNFIVTTTNHPPFDLDAADLGYPVTEPPTELLSQCELCTSKWLNMYGHAWYADRCLGDFIRSVEADYPDSLFVITSDHPSRRYINARPPKPYIWEAPCIFYGPSLLADLDVGAFYGSHIDIGPTLIEMIAPEGHIYHSFGRDMFSPSQSDRYSYGSEIILGPGFVLYRGSPFMMDDSQIMLDESQYEAEHIKQAIVWANRTSGLAWWRIMKGDDFPVSTSTPLAGLEQP